MTDPNIEAACEDIAKGLKTHRGCSPGTATLRHMIARAIDSPTVEALANVFSPRNNSLTKSYSEQIVDILLPQITGVAQSSPDPVQDTWLVGGPDLQAMSGSVESDRVIQLHFRRPATDADRKWLLDAINAKIAADGVALPSTDGNHDP